MKNLKKTSGPGDKPFVGKGIGFILTLIITTAAFHTIEVRAEEELPESWANPPPPRDEPLTQHEFVPSEREPLISMGEDGRLVYRPFSDRGDKLLDWSTCGYMYSEVPIPNVQVQVTLEPLGGRADEVEEMAYPTGTDSRARIQKALDQVAELEPDELGIRGAVLLTRGIYYVEGSLHIRPGVVLRGEGAGLGGTTILALSNDIRQPIVEMRPEEGGIERIGLDDAVVIADSYVPTGSVSLKVADASQFAPGDDVSVRKTVNDQWIDDLGMGQRLRHIRGGTEGFNKRAWSAAAYQVEHMRRIVAIDGNTLTFDAFLPQSFAEAHGGGIVYKVDKSTVGSQSGIESIALVSN